MSSDTTLGSIRPQPPPHNADNDMEIVRSLLNTTTEHDHLQQAQVPTPSLIQDKKHSLIERILQDTHTYQSLRAHNATALAASEQLKHDITQFRESTAYNAKQQIILRRERDMLEHRFKWTRSDFNTALATSAVLRENIQDLILDYQREIALSSSETTDALTKLDDIQYFYTTISQLHAKCQDLTRLTDYYENDIVVLQTLLQHIIAVSFNEQGLPKSNLADAFQTIPDDEMKVLLNIARARLAKSQQDQVQSTQDSEPTSATMGETATDTVVSQSQSLPLTSVQPILPATSAPQSAAIAALPPNSSTSFPTPPTIESRISVIDSFLQKCISITGHFQPQVILDHLRHQSDQLLLLQRSHTLLTSQLFQIQQEKALLMAYFESFLKETTSLKQIIHASQFKIDEDARAIFGLQQRNLTLQQELEFSQQDAILNLTSVQLEQGHNHEVLQSTEKLMDFHERTQNSLALAHMTIYKLRTANEQQNEQITALQAQLAQSQREKDDLIKIVESLEKQ